MSTSGNSVGCTGWAGEPGGAVSRTWPLQGAGGVAREASGTARIRWAPVDGPCIMQRSCCRLGVEGIVISPFGSGRACPGELCVRMAPGLHAPVAVRHHAVERARRSEEHTSELQSLMRISYAVFCLKKKKERRETNTLQ